MVQRRILQLVECGPEGLIILETYGLKLLNSKISFSYVLRAFSNSFKKIYKKERGKKD